MENSTNKVGFGSRLGFILAAAGSAVGLGNIWRFPYLAAKYGGGIFLLVYLILTVTFGFTLMITEISIGRRTGKSVLDAYGAVNKKFRFLGFAATLVPIIVLPYYCVIGGWVIKYLTVFVSMQGEAAANTEGYFGAFISNTPQAAMFLVIYVLLTAGVVLMGVQKGIEKMSKIMMPILIFMTIGISIYSLTVEGALEGLKFYLLPDFSRFSIETIIAAMGQLFYSLSIAMGIMITYGSYMPKSASIETSTRQIELFDTGVAFLSGLMIIPAVVAFAGGPEGVNAGPGLMFETLPKVFMSMPGGNIVGIVFFLLVSLAALTSSISLMETIVAAICEKTKLKRKMACVVVMIGAIAIGMLSVLGYSVWKDVRILGRDMLDFFDFISNNAIMPLVAMFTCILIGYIVKTKFVEEEIESSGVFKSKKLYRIMVKFIAPACLLVIFIWSVFMPAL